MDTTFYKDNPNIAELKVITTVGGDLEYKVNCKKIMDKFYVIDKDCFLVNNRWYRVDSGLIEFDHEKKRWVLKGSADLLQGIVGFNNKGEFIFGKFSPNPYNNCTLHVAGMETHTVIDFKLLVENGYPENFSTGVFLSKKINAAQIQQPSNVLDHTAKGYNIEDNKEEFTIKKLLYENYQPVMSKDVIRYGNMLGDTTFGIELECANGFLPDFIQNRTGVVICRDGSLKDENGKPGPEFVTVPLKGAKGLQTISTLSKELTKRTSLNLNCSLHIHYGTLPTTRIFLVTLFRLCNRIQNEMFTMFPYYKANPSGIKNKNYNQKLPSLGIFKGNPLMEKEAFDSYINTAYKQMFNWLSEGYFPDRKRNRTNKKHPVQAKWERHNRYYWINFMNTIFSERNTVEFRLHGPTTNAQKIINWLFICNAIIKYAMNNQRKILFSTCSISLNDIMDYYTKYGSKGEFLAGYLKAYIQSRKDAFLADYKKGDLVSSWDFQHDSDYVFTYNNVNYLF